MCHYKKERKKKKKKQKKNKQKQSEPLMAVLEEVLKIQA